METLRGVYIKNKENVVFFTFLNKSNFILNNVVICLYMYCLYAINVHKCIKFDNLQVKVPFLC